MFRVFGYRVIFIRFQHAFELNLSDCLEAVVIQSWQLLKYFSHFCSWVKCDSIAEQGLSSRERRLGRQERSSVVGEPERSVRAPSIRASRRRRRVRAGRPRPGARSLRPPPPLVGRGSEIRARTAWLSSPPRPAPATGRAGNSSVSAGQGLALPRGRKVGRRRAFVTHGEEAS